MAGFLVQRFSHFGSGLPSRHARNRTLSQRSQSRVVWSAAAYCASADHARPGWYTGAGQSCR